MVDDIRINIGHYAKGFSIDVDITIAGEGVTAIFGPSGSGKTTFLKMFAGLLRPNRAEINVLGRDWQNATGFYPPYKREIGYVFQEATLFPHLDVEGNLRFATKRAHLEVNQNHYYQIIDAMGLHDLLRSDVMTLSGGERQRVAIARALLIRPKVLIMDEPISALDSKRKTEILPYLERVKNSTNMPIIYVTHSLDEIARLADDIIIFEKGRAIAQGNVSDVLSQLDLSNVFGDEASVVIEGQLGLRDEKWNLRAIECGEQRIWVSNHDAERARLRICAKDVSLSLSASDDSSILNIIPVKIIEIVNHHSGYAMVRCRFGNELLLARVTQKSVDKLGLHSGVKAFAQIKSVAIVA